MKTIRELCDHVAGHSALWHPAALPDADNFPRDIDGIFAKLAERETESRGMLDRTLREHILLKTDLQLDEWSRWFLDQRWLCAARWTAAAADSLSPLILQQPLSFEAIYEWLLIRLWVQQRDLFLQNAALDLYHRLQALDAAAQKTAPSPP